MSPLIYTVLTTHITIVCGTEGGKSAMARWHFDNCKLFVVSEGLESRKPE